MTDLNQLKSQIADYLEANPHTHTLDLAKIFAQPEGVIIQALPKEFVKVISGEQAYTLLGELSTWGNLTTIVEKEGFIWEVKAPFPQGSFARGYYNLNMGPEANPELQLQGHLPENQIAHIALISKPFRGKESYAFAFILASGEVAFKIYLGRDANRQLYPEQVAKFKQL
ncbi:heme utilization cystosolic carrier protein HutX [Psittacicella gerlachiana]|uniref:Heme iron utilization protein n=1 Tax=Psittacicella gerlachiana TaxID=2028574 RepID=A0A3A1YH95_9GAMM|nr:heme utilization cystosolic carrier protein HutX [Psittacicella gerlachiana]RIY37522.1 heme iron utilization protein [Psittacicella gerlachiana]